MYKMIMNKTMHKMMSKSQEWRELDKLTTAQNKSTQLKWQEWQGQVHKKYQYKTSNVYETNKAEQIIDN